MTKLVEDVEKNECLCSVGRDVYQCNSHGKTLWRFLKKFQRELLCDPLSHFWIYSQGKWNHFLKERSIFPCSLQYHSQYPWYRNNLSIFPQVNGLKQCDVTYIGKYYLAIRKRKKSYQLLQRGLNWRAFHYVN